MKGLLYIVLIFAISFLTALIFKIIKVKNINKKGSEQVAPKIYYVTKTSKKAKSNGISIPITVEGAVIEKEKRR